MILCFFWISSSLKAARDTYPAGQRQWRSGESVTQCSLSYSCRQILTLRMSRLQLLLLLL